MSDMIRKSDALVLPYRLSPSLDAADGYYVSVDAIAALPAVTVGVQPLVWDESLEGRWIGTPVVKLGDLAFWVFHREDGTFMRATKDGGKLYPTLEDAQSAAQADYTARILAALTPTAVDASQTANPATNAPDPACDHCGMDPAAIREAALKAARDALAYIDKGHHGMARNILAAYLGAAE